MENKHVDKCRSFSSITAHYPVLVRASLLTTSRASVSEWVRNAVYLGVWRQITFIITWLIYSFVVTAGSACWPLRAEQTHLNWWLGSRDSNVFRSSSERRGQLGWKFCYFLCFPRFIAAESRSLIFSRDKQITRGFSFWILITLLHPPAITWAWDGGYCRQKCDATQNYSLINKNFLRGPTTKLGS